MTISYLILYYIDARIQAQNASIAESPKVNDDPGPSQQSSGGTYTVSQSSDVNDDSVIEIVPEQISIVPLTREESSVNKLNSVTTYFSFVNQFDSVLKSFNMANITA